MLHTSFSIIALAALFQSNIAAADITIPPTYEKIKSANHRVQVTGSHIRQRVNYIGDIHADTAAPVRVIPYRDIKQRGYRNIDDMLKRQVYFY